MISSTSMHRGAPCTTVHHDLCAPAPWCITVVVHRIAPCTTVRDRPCAPALRCIIATLHQGARCSTMCDPATTAVGCYVVREFNPSPTLTRTPSYYTPTGSAGRRRRRSYRRWREQECVLGKLPLPSGRCRRRRRPGPAPGGNPGENPRRSVGSSDGAAGRREGPRGCRGGHTGSDAVGKL